MPTLGIVPTSLAVIGSPGRLTKELLPGVAVVNLVDDTRLTDAREHGVDAGSCWPAGRVPALL